MEFYTNLPSAECHCSLILSEQIRNCLPVHTVCKGRCRVINESDLDRKISDKGTKRGGSQVSYKSIFSWL